MTTRRFLIDAYKERGTTGGIENPLSNDKLEEDATNRAVLELLADIYWETSDYQESSRNISYPWQS